MPRDGLRGAYATDALMGRKGQDMPESNAEMVDSVNAQEAVDAATENQEVNPSMEDSSPKTYTADEVDAKIKARIDKQNAKHAGEIAELQKQMKELEERAAQADAERAELQRRKDLSDWADAAAKAHGVPANILRGETAEEFMAHAEAIRAAIPSYPVVRDTGEPKRVGPTRESILALPEKERLAAIRQNPELFTQ